MIYRRLLCILAFVLVGSVATNARAQEAKIKAAEARAIKVMTGWKNAEPVTKENLPTLAGGWTLTTQLQTDLQMELRTFQDVRPSLVLVVGDIDVPAHQVQQNVDNFFSTSTKTKTINVPEQHFDGKATCTSSLSSSGTYNFLVKQKGIVFKAIDMYGYTRNCRYSSANHELYCRLKNDYEEGTYEAFSRTSELLPPEPDPGVKVPAPDHGYPSIVEDKP